MLALLEDGYQREIVENSEGGTTEREVLKLHPLLAPYFVAIIPWNKQEQLQEKACQIYQELLNETSFTTTYEESKWIGKSYHRQDAIGTYYCLTVDSQTLNDDTVTIRERDNLKQIRLPRQEVAQFFNQKYYHHYQEFKSKEVKI